MLARHNIVWWGYSPARNWEFQNNNHIENIVAKMAGIHINIKVREIIEWRPKYWPISVMNIGIILMCIVFENKWAQNLLILTCES